MHMAMQIYYFLIENVQYASTIVKIKITDHTWHAPQ